MTCLKLKEPDHAPAPPATDTDAGTDWRDTQVREWLLLLLRFAVTHDPRDHAATLVMADELDALGLDWRPSGPRFFLRTSDTVCRAIVAVDDPHRCAILRQHASRIDAPRLRRAFEAATGLTQTDTMQQAPKPQRRPYLWKGL